MHSVFCKPLLAVKRRLMASWPRRPASFRQLSACGVERPEPGPAHLCAACRADKPALDGQWKPGCSHAVDAANRTMSVTVNGTTTAIRLGAQSFSGVSLLAPFDLATSSYGSDRDILPSRTNSVAFGVNRTSSGNVGSAGPVALPMWDIGPLKGLLRPVSS